MGVIWMCNITERVTGLYTMTHVICIASESGESGAQGAIGRLGGREPDTPQRATEKGDGRAQTVPTVQ